MKEKIEKEYGECMQNLYNQLEVNSAWFIKYYQINPGRFWAILRQRIRSMRYTLEYDGEIEDLMQSSIEKVLKQFQVKNTIPFQYRHTLFSLCAPKCNQSACARVKPF